jgi:hypothetical protein
MNGCATDYCSVGVEARGEHTISMSGCSLWNHGPSLIVDGEAARVRVSGSELKSNGGPALHVRQSDHVVVTGCSLLRPMKEHAGPAAVLAGGRAVLGSNHVESQGAGLRIERGATAVVAHGNVVRSHSGQPVVDKRGADAQVVMDGNLL